MFRKKLKLFTSTKFNTYGEMIKRGYQNNTLQVLAFSKIWRPFTAFIIGRTFFILPYYCCNRNRGVVPLQSYLLVILWDIAIDLTSTILRGLWCSNLYRSCISRLGSIPGLATYFRFSFRFFKKGSCQLLAKVCARSTG